MFLKLTFATIVLAAALAAGGALYNISSASAEPALQTDPPLADAACQLVSGPMRTVTDVIDGETVKLDNGSLVRLIGALAPRATDSGAVSGLWPLEQEAEAFLRSLVVGKPVRLATGRDPERADVGDRNKRTADADRAPPATGIDRHGRRLAHLFLGSNPETAVWVQGAMLRAGLARAYNLPGHSHCLKELVAHEAVAVRARIGVWSNAIYRVKRATPGPGLMRFRNRFERVRGKIMDVAVTRTATYLNFGDDWRRDFTIRIDREMRNREAAWSALLPALKGRTVTVRGWIERRNGPEIQIWHPDQLHIESEQPAVSPDVTHERGPNPHVASPRDDSASDADTTPPASQDMPETNIEQYEKPARSRSGNAPADVGL